MPYEISVARLKQLQSNIHYLNDGDGFEQLYWPLFKERFPNIELFWRLFIVPMTKRVEIGLHECGRIERREGIAEDLWSISYLNYSAFMHLSYAAQHLSLPMQSSFGDFYSHLGTTCDLAEDFLLRVHLLVLECSGKKSPLLEETSKETILQMVSEWYDKKYPKLYENYHSKGKGFPLHVPPRQRIASDYVGEESSWRSYEKFSQSIRTYRNRIVHDVLIGEIVGGDGARLVPRKEKISSYQKLADVFSAARIPEKLKTDFMLKQEQMISDYAEMQIRLNAVWSRPLADMDFLFFQSLNTKLHAKYNLRLVE